jgi:hypothetical protein
LGLAKTITRREKTRKKRRVSRKERRKHQREVQVQIDEAIAKTVREVLERILQDEVTVLLGRAKGVRRDPNDLTLVRAQCNECGTQYRSQFYRAGYYERGILTFEVWSKIDVPRISCVCGGMVDFEFIHLVPYGRTWFDIEERARELAGLCVSLRDSVEVLAWRNQQPLSIATLNGIVNEAASLAVAFRSGEIAKCPPVVMLDGIWLKMLEPTGERYVDKKGRQRERLKKTKFPILVAYGVDPESGRRWVLDWERGREEDKDSWQRLLERLEARGIRAERGLMLFVHDGSAGLESAFEMVHFGQGVHRQRCIFHKLRNVGKAVKGEEGMSREEKRKRRAEVLADASEVYRGESEEEIRRNLAKFKLKWQATESAAVTTLERDFDMTLSYLKVLEIAKAAGKSWRVEDLRATSALERVQRHFRQKVRQVVIFHSEKGIAAGIQLVIYHRGLAENSTEPWVQLLEEALLAA